MSSGMVPLAGNTAYDPQFANLGKPVTGNTGLPNPNNGMVGAVGTPDSSSSGSGFVPLGGSPSNPAPGVGASNGGIISGSPSVGTGGTVSDPNASGITPGQITALGTGLTTTSPVPVAGIGTPVTSPSSVVNGAVSGATPVSSAENKQLTDTFGKGTGSLIGSEIANLGSNDSSYMQAYENAMAGTNAENLATLNTTLGNEGVGANSSTAAIENADFESNVTSQEGLQEQQLQMNDLNQLLGLTESTEAPSVAEVNSGGFLNDLASVTSSIGNLIPFGSGGNKGANAAAPQELNTTGGADPLGLNSGGSPGSMDLSSLTSNASIFGEI